MNPATPVSPEAIIAELCSACQQLLDCPDLNLDELEDFSRAAIVRAEAAITGASVIGIHPLKDW